MSLKAEENGISGEPHPGEEIESRGESSESQLLQGMCLDLDSNESMEELISAEEPARGSSSADSHRITEGSPEPAKVAAEHFEIDAEAVDEGQISSTDIEDGEIRDNTEDPGKNLCRHYQKGRCAFGQGCRFLHMSDKGYYTMLKDPDLFLATNPRNAGGQFLPGNNLDPPYFVRKGAAVSSLIPSNNSLTRLTTVFDPVVCDLELEPAEAESETEWDRTLKETQLLIEKSRLKKKQEESSKKKKFYGPVERTVEVRSQKKIPQKRSVSASPVRKASPSRRTCIDGSKKQSKRDDVAETRLVKRRTYSSNWRDPWRRSKTPPKKKRRRSPSSSSSSDDASSWTSRGHHSSSSCDRKSSPRTSRHRRSRSIVRRSTRGHSTRRPISRRRSRRSTSRSDSSDYSTSKKVVSRRDYRERISPKKSKVSRVSPKKSKASRVSPRAKSRDISPKRRWVRQKEISPKKLPRKQSVDSSRREQTSRRPFHNTSVHSSPMVSRADLPSPGRSCSDMSISPFSDSSLSAIFEPSERRSPRDPRRQRHDNWTTTKSSAKCWPAESQQTASTSDAGKAARSRVVFQIAKSKGVVLSKQVPPEKSTSKFDQKAASCIPTNSGGAQVKKRKKMSALEMDLLKYHSYGASSNATQEKPAVAAPKAKTSNATQEKPAAAAAQKAKTSDASQDVTKKPGTSKSSSSSSRKRSLQNTKLKETLSKKEMLLKCLAEVNAAISRKRQKVLQSDGIAS